jgi:hypothetical protein
MNYRDYLASSRYPGDQLLEDWRWLVGDRLELCFVTKFGDAFLRDPASRTMHLLEVGWGKLWQVADSENQFEQLASDPKNIEKWFMREVVECQKLLGMDPGDNQCLSYDVPPKLGGQLDPGNINICDIAVHFSVNGQLLRKVKDLAPGTKISEIKVNAPTLPSETRKPWWRFW